MSENASESSKTIVNMILTYIGTRGIDIDIDMIINYISSRENYYINLLNNININAPHDHFECIEYNHDDNCNMEIEDDARNCSEKIHDFEWYVIDIIFCVEGQTWCENCINILRNYYISKTVVH